MESQNIILLEHENTHIEILQNSFTQDGYKCECADDLNHINEASLADYKGIILINYQTLLKSSREEIVSFFKKISEKNTLVYNVPDNANQRLAFYELGALRVYGSTYSIEEIYYSAGWLLQQLMVQDKNLHHYSSGSLHDFPLTSLLRMLGKEKKNGVLKIITPHNSGNIFYFNGEICDAQAGMHRGVPAFLHMLSWETGFFTFNNIHDPEINRTITLSNIALFLLGDANRRKYRQIFKELCRPNCILRLKNKGDLQQLSLGIDPAFIQYLSLPRPILELFENPYYTYFETLDILVQLKQNGFLEIHESIARVIEHSSADIVEESATMEVMAWLPEDTAMLRSILDLRSKKSTKIMIFSVQAEAKTNFISQVAKTRSLVRSQRSIDIAEIKLDAELELYLIGLTMDQMAVDTLGSMTDGLSGFIFLIDGQQTDQFEYNNYIMNQLLNLKRVPGVAAVYNLKNEEELISTQVKFNLPAALMWLQYFPGRAQSTKRVLLSFQPAVEEIRKEA